MSFETVVDDGMTKDRHPSFLKAHKRTIVCSGDLKKDQRTEKIKITQIKS